MPDTHPNVARSAALQRIEEARAMGAETLVTACQHCRQNLTRWQEENPMPVVDLVDMVYEAAGLSQTVLNADWEMPYDDRNRFPTRHCCPAAEAAARRQDQHGAGQAGCSCQFQSRSCRRAASNLHRASGQPG